MSNFEEVLSLDRSPILCRHSFNSIEFLEKEAFLLIKDLQKDEFIDLPFTDKYFDLIYLAAHIYDRNKSINDTTKHANLGCPYWQIELAGSPLGIGAINKMFDIYQTYRRRVGIQAHLTIQ
jgi:hypothetical protein